MYARALTLKAWMLIGLLATTGAHAASMRPSEPVLPILVPETPNPAPWPRAIDGSTWIPVFVLGEQDAGLSGPLNLSEPVGSVLLGLAQVRTQTSDAGAGVSVAPSLRWRLSEDLRLASAFTVTEFVPCRSLMQIPLAPVRADACEAFSNGGGAAVGVSSSLITPHSSLTLGYSESPAIWVLPGAIRSADSSPRPAGVPLAPLPLLQSETAQTLSLSGDLLLNDRTRVGVALAMSRLPHLENSPDIGRVQFSVAYGAFSADMATQMIRQGLESLSPWWAGLDLGVSWRTPWAGTLSVGAHNLISRGTPPDLGETPDANVSEDNVFSRTPYVRYEQDF